MPLLRLLACSLALACTLPVAVAGPNWAAGAGLGLGGERNVAVRLSATGTVTAVDPEARLMAVNGPRGDITFRLDPKVENLERIKVGERVNVDYVAALLLTRRGTDAAREQVLRARRHPGPGVSLADAYERPVTFVTEVLSVNKQELVVRLKGPAGEVRDYWVHDRSDLASVRPGDYIVVSMNQAVAVEVTPAE